MTGPLRVLFVSHSDGLYGAERSLYTLLKGLRERGNITPIVMLPGEGELKRQLEDEGFCVIVAPYKFWFSCKRSIPSLPGRTWRVFSNLIAFFLACMKVRKLPIDAIYTNTLAVPIGVFLAKAFGKPHIWHARELISDKGLLGGSFDMGLSFSVSVIRTMSAKIICNSEMLKSDLAKIVDKSLLSVVYNGFDFNPPSYLSSSEKYLATVESKDIIDIAILGYLFPGKGQDQAIRATASLREQNIPVKLHVAGNGSNRYTRRLKKLCDQLMISDYVEFHGFISNPEGLIARSAIVLACSGIETFGRVAVESLASRTPVVGADSGALPEILENGKAGLLYEPGNQYDLAECIKTLIEDREQYLKISEYGFESVIHRFSREHYVQDIEKIILDVAASVK